MDGTRRYPTRPVVGVGVVIWRGDRVLLVRRGRPPRQGSWSLPGGAQELGETAFEAGRREAKEETGLDIEVLGLIDVVDSIHPGADGRIEYHYTLVEIAAESTTGEACAGDDAAAIGWFGAGELRDLELPPGTERLVLSSRRLRR